MSERRGGPAFCALSDEIDRITVKQLVSAGVIEENGHQIPDFRATAFRKRQSTKPGLNLYGSDGSKLMFLPVRANPAAQVRLIDLFVAWLRQLFSLDSSR